MSDLAKVFDALRIIMLPYASKLDCTSNSEDQLYINTKFVQKNKRALFFGAVEIKKNYVSYHLMPVYVNPGLLTSASPNLMKRMQGKSCFNFSSIDPSLFQEIAELTNAGFEDYRRAGYV